MTIVVVLLGFLWSSPPTSTGLCRLFTFFTCMCVCVCVRACRDEGAAAAALVSCGKFEATCGYLLTTVTREPSETTAAMVSGYFLR